MFDCQHGSWKNGRNWDNVQNHGQSGSTGKDREELIDDLTELLERMDENSDETEVDRLLEELDPEGELASQFDVERSLAEFHQKYEALFDAPEPARPKGKRRIMRNSVRVAIVAVFFVSCIIVAQTSGFNVLGTIAQWNDELFHFSWIDEETKQSPVEEDDSLAAMLKRSGIEEKLAPTWLPEEAELTELSAEVIQGNSMYLASYTLKEGELYISIYQDETIPFSEIEKNDQTVDIYTVDGVDHMIMSDVMQSKVTWRNGVWECMIAGNVTRDELIAMIDSIYQ